MRTLSLSTFAAALLLAPAFAHAGNLSVTPENLTNTDGNLLVGVHTTSADFPDEASRLAGQM